MRQTLFGVIITALFVSSCSEPPTKLAGPSTIAGVPNITQAAGTIGKKAQDVDRGNGQFPTMGHATTVNTTDTDQCFILIAFNYGADPVNQPYIDSSNIECVPHGATADLTMGINEDLYCEVQTDIFRVPNAVKAARYTLSDFPAGPWATPGRLFPGRGCKKVDPPCELSGSCEPPPCPPGGCPQVCRVPAVYQFDAGTILAQNSSYPTETGLIPFAPPQNVPLVLHITTGDVHNKANEFPADPTATPQAYEIVYSSYYDAGGNMLGSLPATNDVPDNGTPFDIITWDFPVVFNLPVAFVKIVHAGPPVSGPDNSVELVSLGVTCAPANVTARRLR